MATNTIHAVALGLLLLAAPAHAQDQEPAPAEKPVDYAAEGFPAADRAWTGPDFLEAARAVQALVQRGDAALLPRRGLPLFERMADKAPLLALKDPQTPAAERIQRFMGFEAAPSLFKLYFAAGLKLQPDTSQPGPLDGELIELCGLALAYAESGILVCQEYLATLPKDETYPTRLQGLQRVKSGMGTMFDGALTMLSDVDGFDAKTRLRLLEHIAAHLPACFPSLFRESQLGIVTRLDQLGAAEPEGELKERAAALRAELGDVEEPPRPEEKEPKAGED